jgi:transposase-like protein
VTKNPDLEFKAEAVREILREQKTMSEITSE